MAKRKGPKSKKSEGAKKRASRPPKTIGILHGGSQHRHDENIAEFMAALGLTGYTDIQIWPAGEPLWSRDDPQILSGNARKLAANAGLDLIIAAGGTASVYAIKEAQDYYKIYTPVVFTSFSEQNAPAPNMTGVNAQTSGLDTSRMELLYEKAPSTETTFGVLENPTRPKFDPTKLQAWADSKKPPIQLNRQPVFRNAGEPDDAVIARIDVAFQVWAQNNIKFAQVCADPIFNDFRQTVTKAARRNGITTIYQWNEFRKDGATTKDLVYGTLLKDAYTRAGTMAGGVLDDPEGIAKVPVYPLQPQLFPAKEGRRKGRR
jgi:hypothetical protein